MNANGLNSSFVHSLTAPSLSVTSTQLCTVHSAQLMNVQAIVSQEYCTVRRCPTNNSPLCTARSKAGLPFHRRERRRRPSNVGPSDCPSVRRSVGYRLSIGFSHEPREHGLLFEVGRRHLPLLVVAGHRHVVVVGCRCCGREGGSR